MIIALAALLAAAADPIPFAPPIDQPLRYEQIERRPGPDGEMRFTLVQEARYLRDGTGYILALRAVSAHADAPPTIAAMFDAGMRPMMNVTVRTRLSAAGEPGSVVDADATWAQVVASIDAVASTLPADAPADRRAMAEQSARQIASLSPAAREQMMRGPADALVGLDLPAIAAGETATLSRTVDTPMTPELEGRGTIRRDADAGGLRLYHGSFTTPASAAAALAARMRAAAADRDPESRARLEQQAAMVETLRLDEEEDTSLSASSGLLHEQHRRISALDPSAPGGAQLLSDQTLRLIP